MPRRAPERRSGAVISVAQILLRPLARLLARRTWLGTENLPPRGAVIACGNHSGPFDAIAYGHLLQASGAAPRFLAKESLFRVPVLGGLLRASGQIPVARGTARTARALDAAERALQRGELIMVFPEGTYTRDPHGWPMRPRLGAARLALRTGAPLLPIACWGSAALWPVGAVLPTPIPRAQLTLRVGSPIVPARREGETETQAAARLMAAVMGAITEMLAEIRGETPPSAVHDPRQDSHRPEEGWA
ncbi:lysophospholipid acyltransferase family protein [Brachybacterium hainanense]|uniref:Lysophospholipid acyltransferase family protein n=1 Tax=Brachybacterium hainanense TaxID=1541174 RepID=A0ABV6R8N7_9MICO